MSKSLHEIAKDYIREVADAVAKVSDLSDAREEPDTKALYCQKGKRRDFLITCYDILPTLKLMLERKNTRCSYQIYA